jgi:hypothetical protein
MAMGGQYDGIPLHVWRNKGKLDISQSEVLAMKQGAIDNPIESGGSSFTVYPWHQFSDDVIKDKKEKAYRFFEAADVMYGEEMEQSVIDRLGEYLKIKPSVIKRWYGLRREENLLKNKKAGNM